MALGYSGIVEDSTGGWNGVLWTSVMTEGSVCMRVMDVRVRRGPDDSSFGVHSPTTYRNHLMLHDVGDHQLQLAVTFCVSAG